MGSGGARIGSGRKPKPAALKLLEGNPGKRKINVLEISDSEELPSTPPEYLSAKAKEIYSTVYNWLSKIGCTKGILPYNLEEYSHCKSRWLECEEQNSKHGLLIKNAAGQAVRSPYVELAQMYLRQTNEVWAKIYAVIRESKLTEWDSKSPNEDVMEKLLLMPRKPIKTM